MPFAALAGAVGRPPRRGAPVHAPCSVAQPFRHEAAQHLHHRRLGAAGQAHVGEARARHQRWRHAQLRQLAGIDAGARGGHHADDLAALAVKAARDGKPLTYASVGVGSFYHLLGAKLAKDLGVAMTHVPYKGAADAFRDLAGDQVDIFITPYGLAQTEFITNGRMKAIAVLTPQRQRLLPNTPSTTESKALKHFTAEIGTGYFVKRDTPEPIVQALHQGLQKVLTDTQLRAGLFAMSQEVSPAQTLAEADRAYQQEIAHYQAIAQAIGLQAGH